jgi:hypothetical protein
VVFQYFSHSHYQVKLPGVAVSRLIFDFHVGYLQPEGVSPIEPLLSFVTLRVLHLNLLKLVLDDYLPVLHVQDIASIESTEPSGHSNLGHSVHATRKFGIASKQVVKGVRRRHSFFGMCGIRKGLGDLWF